MLWYKKLYTGETAEKKRFAIIQKIRSGGIPASAYVIVPAANPKNLLDIYLAADVCTPQEDERRRQSGRELLILGIAWGYEEALELAGQMVDEVYRATGGFDLRAYLGLAEYDSLLLQAAGKPENCCVAVSDTSDASDAAVDLGVME